ncbi:MAG: hypothetical protein ACRYG7_41095 [Janthinobacterium lividum]
MERTEAVVRLAALKKIHFQAENLLGTDEVTLLVLPAVVQEAVAISSQTRAALAARKGEGKHVLMAYTGKVSASYRFVPLAYMYLGGLWDSAVRYFFQSVALPAYYA